MDDATLAARQCAGQMAVFEHNIGSAGTVLRPAPGVLATVVAAAPDRSLPNSVLYSGASALGDAVLDTLEAAYASAGVLAWTVWVRPGDEALAARLAARGHRLDARPMLMAAELADMRIAPLRDLDFDPDPSWALMGRLNDRAFGLPGDLERLGEAIDDDRTRRWVARAAGEPVACAGIHVHDGVAEVWMVAVVPEARGRGLAAELLRHALSAARDEQGATTTALESSAMGEATYLRLGYRALGRLGMWERRSG